MQVLSIVGARPQFIKAAVLRRLFPQNGISETLVHTGQHYDHNMSDVFFKELEIRPPDYRIELQGRSHGAMTGEILQRVESILQTEKPTLCIVYGDTNSTIAGALAAAKLSIPVCHVEAGLRSFNRHMPEEINRILTDHISDVLFCSTNHSVENLQRENITEGVYHVGDIMYDAVRLFTASAQAQGIVDKYLAGQSRPLAVMTIHRQETVSSAKRLAQIIAYCRDFTDEHILLFPAHPRTRQRIEQYGINLGNIQIIEPVSYLEMQSLISQSNMVLTDSGGLQKEAYFNGVRCVTLRDETEWTETIDFGWNRLWTQKDYLSEPRNITEYGDGDSGVRIISILKDRYS